MDRRRRAFHDRREAGRVLARRLHHFSGHNDLLVLALPRGGVPVGYEVAQHLDAPLDIFMVRKIGVPGHEELAMGAIAEGAFRVINHDVVSSLQIPAVDIERTTQREHIELERRAARYRGSRPNHEIRDTTAVLIDDGLATGASMRVAVHAVRAQEPAACIVAVPVAPRETCQALEDEADEVVCAVTPTTFQSVGAWYEQFEQVSDEEVEQLLDEAHHLLESSPKRRR